MSDQPVPQATRSNRKQIAQSNRTWFLLAIVMVVFGFGGPFLASLHSDSSAQAAGGSTLNVSIGMRGEINAAVMGCQVQQDSTTFDASFSQAQIANDAVGKTDAVTAALNSSCEVFQPGDTGLLIAASGFLDPLDEMRMDNDQNAYWIDASFVSPAPQLSSRSYVIPIKMRAFKDMKVCRAAISAVSGGQSLQILEQAVSNRDYYDFPAGTALHVIEDDKSGFIIVADQSGDQGCLGFLALPGYDVPY